ncbi:hypothetical protein PVAND_009814 [Polypedilum vanderplanki]|uniref:Mediator complex subunit Med12 domain-containing protein n=1 Tax=Polypedilum vanderplanki TaxID=319348 RepID=A0A9J6CDN9_POLVA|nr:hypothetical protein PVAND_009814 [Polypedilum vanderplanki]
MFSEAYLEKRPLKRPKLGPADVYPQEVKQKEDELTSLNVKHGFSATIQSSEEFGTARNCNVTASKVGAYFNAILAKKEELATLTDSGRKKQHVKDNFWPVTQRTKQTLDNWFKDLAGNKPLSSLAKKAPSFNKKEEIFAMLCENQVTMQRAAWFIKLSSAYTVAVSEAKIKKRQMPDPATEWTGTMIKFLKDLVPKLLEYYHTGPPIEKPSSNISSNTNPSSNLNTSSSSSTSTLTIPPPLASPAGSSSTSTSLIPIPATPQEEQKLALKQWNYCTQLCKYMFEEGLLDKHEFLNWILELLDKLRTQPQSEDGILKLYLPLTLAYMQDFVMSERLSRKLAYLSAKKLSSMLNDMLNHIIIDGNKNDQNSENKTGENGEIKNLNPYEKALEEYLTCCQHRDIIMQLSCILQVITLDCPTALIWSGVGENRQSTLTGSPLDHLPISPSTLPMPEKSPKSNEELRMKLKAAENNIKYRSQQAESRWCADKWRTLTGNATIKLLTILDTLDSYFFDRMDSNNSLDTLYAKIFPSLQDSSREHGNSSGDNKDQKFDYDVNSDEDTVKILCEWAVSTHRWGEHRAFVVARLLDKRQNEVLAMENEANNIDDKDSDFGSFGTPVFQGILLKFLDNAPVLEENGSLQNRNQFKNLVHLFSELIRNDVFSHDAYMCTLISRGDLLNPPSTFTSNIVTKSSTNVAQTSSSANAGGDDDFFSEIDFKLKPPKMEEFDDSNVDDDLEKLIQNIKDGQQNSMDAPDSPKDNENLTNLPSITNDKNMTSGNAGACRHYLYTMHFPLSQDDASQHDCNQRYVLLYGVGKERDERKHSVKKMSKEICKLFSKKFSIDVAEGGKVKKHSRNEFNFESTLNKCQMMCYFDQHFVTWQCAVTVQEMLNSFANGNSNYLPVAEHVAFLFDLMEVALNIYGVIDMCIQILKELPDVEAQLMAKNSNLIKSYTTTLSLYIVGILRRYNSCLLLSPDQTTAVFEGLCKVVKHVSNPSDCTSAERCILAYLYDLYLACSILRTKPPSEPFHNAYPKIKQTIYAPIKLSPSPQQHNPQYMMEILTNPKRGKIESSWGRQLSESQQNRYSFVCNAIIAICRESDNDKLNDIAIMCAELTACCNSLSAEWFGALGALCNTKNETGYYVEILNSVDLQNVHIYNSIAVFTCILIARHCFSLVDFVALVALPALLLSCRSEAIMNEAEASARLTCHILLRLFQAIEYPQASMYSVSTSPIQSVGPMNSNIKLSCDRLLLGGAQKNIPVAPVLAVLKAILVVADATVNKTSYGSGKKSGLNTPVHPGSTPKSSMSGPVDLSHILGTREDMGILGDDDMGLDLGSASNNLNSSENAPSLSDFAHHVLKQICTQEWVLECCLKNCDEMCKDEILLDNMLTNKQAQRLLHMIVYDQETNAKIEANMDQKSQIVRILENLEQWSLRISLLDLQLMYKQTQSNSSEFSSWLDTVARAAIDVFIPNEERKLTKNKPPKWLIAPLVGKLPSEVQGRILKVAGQVLESTNSFGAKNKSSENTEGNGSNGRKRNTQIDNQPFLGLILTCLRGQDDQKETLLQSLHSQLSQFLQNKDLENVGGIDDPNGRQEMLSALQLRFSLVGSMFDTIQKNSTSTTDWALLLAQMMSQGIIDLNNNSALFYTALDMLTTLIHSTLIIDNERDENKKLYTNLMKKLRKELADKNSPTIKLVRQLLPHAKAACSNTCEVIACEPVGSLMDTKGLRVNEKEKVSMWDLLEGHKNPAPLLWTWFGAVKMERKPLTYEENHRLLKYHTHSLVKPSSYYYEPLPLPPEDAEEPMQDKNRDDKADTPSSVESPAAPGSAKRKAAKRQRKPKPAATPTQINPMQQQMQNQGMMGQQMMNPQMNQQFNPNQQMNNMGMMQNNMMMNQMNPMGSGMGQNMNQGQMQMNNQMGMNQMQNNPQMGQMNPMQYQQQQQQQQMNQMGQMNMNMNQNMNMAQQNMNMNMNQMGQQNQNWNYNPMQQQQAQQQQQQGPQGNQQQFYNQNVAGGGGGMSGNMGNTQMNQFDRPPLTTSKQAISNMLQMRQRHPNPNPNTQFNMQQQRMQMMQNQQQQQNPQMLQRQQMLRMRMGKPMNTTGGMINQTVNTNAMGMGGAQQQNPNAMMQGNQQAMMATGGQNQGMMGQQAQNPINTMQQQGNQQAMMTPGNQNQGMMGQQNPNAMNTMQQQSNQQGMMGAGNQNQGMMGVGNQMGNMQAQMHQQGNTGNPQQQGGMFNPNQYQNMNQNFSGYNPTMGNQGGMQNQQQGTNAGGGAMMNNFQQTNNPNVAAQQQPRNPQAEFLAQQRRNQFMQNQQQQQNPQMQQQQQAPNVTMNSNMGSNMNVGPQQGGNLPPYRQQQGGKPMINPSTQQFQEMRMRQMMMKQQQQQQQQGMGPNQNLQQQTPALVAQLQRSMPSQMMGQQNQQQQQQNFNQGPF